MPADVRWLRWLALALAGFRLRIPRPCEVAVDVFWSLVGPDVAWLLVGLQGLVYELNRIPGPKIVPCGHTFCLQCLTQFRANECPTCRAEFRWPPSELTDNFLALEETADMKFVQRTLWCDTCCDAPRVECVEGHEVCSSRTAQARLQGELVSALRAEQAVLGRDRDVRARMTATTRRALDALELAGGEAASVVSDELRLLTRSGSSSSCAGLSGSSNGVKAAKMTIRTSETRTNMVRDALAVMDATEAVLKVKCGGEWRSFSASFRDDEDPDEDGDEDRDEDGAGSGDARASRIPSSPRSPAETRQVRRRPGVAADDCKMLLLYAAYVLSRQAVRGVRRSASFVVTATVKAARGNGPLPLPEVTIEFDEMQSMQTLVEQWSKGWRRYSICPNCLESVHTQAFTPRPPDAEGTAVQRGAVCVGRSTGRYHLILCHEVGAKFRLPLGASFKVVGRVVKNLAALEAAVESINSASDVVQIVPKP